MKGTIDALGHTRRAAGLGVTPPKTGFRAVPWAALGGAGGLSVPLYYGLNATMGDQLSPSERVAAAFVLAPLAAVGGAKAATKYTQSDLGKLLHFATPDINVPVLGGLQRATRSSGKGLGAGIEDEYRRGQLGHRGDIQEGIPDTF